PDERDGQRDEERDPSRPPEKPAEQQVARELKPGSGADRAPRVELRAEAAERVERREVQARGSEDPPAVRESRGQQRRNEERHRDRECPALPRAQAITAERERDEDPERHEREPLRQREA